MVEKKTRVTFRDPTTIVRNVEKYIRSFIFHRGTSTVHLSTVFKITKRRTKAREKPAVRGRWLGFRLLHTFEKVAWISGGKNEVAEPT